jgi:hypothetical protein
VNAARTCSVEGCGTTVEACGFCAAHLKRRQRGRPLDSPLHRRAAAAFSRVQEAAIALADAEGDEEYRLAKDRLRKADEAWARARGWMPLEEAETVLLSRGWCRPAAADAVDNGCVSRTGT